MLPDFQNLYTNKSYLSRETQVQLFRQLIEILQAQISDAAERLMQVKLHGLLFSILSETDFNQTIFMAADSSANQLLAAYSEQLRPDNIVVTSDLDASMDYSSEEFGKMLSEYFELLRQEIPKPFSIMIVPYPMLEAKFDQWQRHIDGMLAYRGRIIVYDCPKNVRITERFTLSADYSVSQERTIKVLQTNKVFEPSDINLTLSLRIQTLQNKILGLAGREEAGAQALDKLIYDAQLLENEIISHHDEFPEADLKYRINEVKNALLDVRYAEKADIAYFMEVLGQETNKLISWT